MVVTLMIVCFGGCDKTTPPDIWDGSISETYAGGDGSAQKPYTIEKVSQLALLAKEVNAGTDYKAVYFSLKNDLDLNNCEWIPIGNGEYSFSGIFDGNNHTVSGKIKYRVFSQ